jgi:hypothetical protein
MASTRKKTSPTRPEPELRDEVDGRRSALRPDEMPADVLEFITAIDDYKRLNQRPFPTWSEVLEVLKTLGYQRT